MITLQEIKNLLSNEKWLIYDALRDDADVQERISDEASFNESDVNEEQILKYIKIIDNRLDEGKSTVFSMEEVLNRLHTKRKAI